MCDQYNWCNSGTTYVPDLTFYGPEWSCHFPELPQQNPIERVDTPPPKTETPPTTPGAVTQVTPPPQPSRPIGSFMKPEEPNLLPIDKPCGPDIPEHCRRECNLTGKSKEIIIAINTYREPNAPLVEMHQSLCHVAQGLAQSKDVNNLRKLADHWCYPEGRVWGWYGSSHKKPQEMVDKFMQDIRDEVYEIYGSNPGNCKEGQPCPTDRDTFLDPNLTDIGVYTWDDTTTVGKWHFGIVLGYSPIQCTLEKL